MFRLFFESSLFAFAFGTLTSYSKELPSHLHSFLALLYACQGVYEKDGQVSDCKECFASRYGELSRSKSSPARAA